jgi:hypothetical protein
MTATTTAIAATDCVIQLDNNAGALVDISGQSNSVEVSFENGVAEFRPFSTQWKTRKVVGKDAPISMAGVYSTNDAEALGILRGWFFGGDDSARSLQIDVPDSNAGGDRISGEFVLSTFSYTLDSEADDFVRWSAELMPTGAVSHAEIGS